MSGRISASGGIDGGPTCKGTVSASSMRGGTICRPDSPAPDAPPGRVTPADGNVEIGAETLPGPLGGCERRRDEGGRPVLSSNDGANEPVPAAAGTANEPVPAAAGTANEPVPAAGGTANEPV